MRIVCCNAKQKRHIMLHAITASLNDRLLRLAFLCITLMGIAVASIHPFQSVIGIEQLGFSRAAYALIGMTTFTQYFAMASLAANANKTLDKDMSLSLVRAAFAGAFGLTPPVIAVAVAGGMELTSVYGFAALVNTAVLVLILRTWPDEQTAFAPQSGISFFEGLRELAAGGVLLRLILIAVLIGVNALYNILLGLLILNNLGGTTADVGWFAGGVALVEVPVMLSVAVAMRYITRSAMLMLGAVIYCGFLAVLAAVPTMQVAWPLIIPAGIGAGILLSVTVGYVQDR